MNRKITSFLFTGIVAAGLMCNVTSCKNDTLNNPLASTTITEADAAELTTDAVIPSTGGLVTQMNSSLVLIKASIPACGLKKDTSFVQSSATGVKPSYTYGLSWEYSLNCTGAIPNSLVFSFTGNSTYSGTRMSSSDKSTGGFTVTGFGTASQYLINANYARVGTATSQINNKYTFNNTITIVATNVAVDKTTKEIVSGSATVSIVATSTSGKTFNFSGTITFLGSKKATLVLNSGTTYNIQWS